MTDEAKDLEANSIEAPDAEAIAGADVTAVLERAAAALAELHALDLERVGDDLLGEVALGTQHLRGRLEAAEARVLSRWDARACWRPSGAKSGAAWLAWKQHIPIQLARQRLRHARALRSLPAIAEAWAAGDIDRAHVGTLLGLRNARTAGAFDEQHQQLLDHARRLGFRDFRAVCDYWRMAADPDGAEQDAQHQRDARDMHLSQSIDGMWFGRLVLDPISGEILDSTLRAIETELFEADWAEARARLGTRPSLGDLARSPGQRRADALVEMATRALSTAPGARRPAPLFSVVVGLETLRGPILELFNRNVITPASAARYLSEADIERIVFDGPSRVIDVGAKRRFYTGAIRRAIEVRDRRCFHPSCDEIPQRPQIDHIHQAAKGGPSTQHNGRLGCAYHNQWRNQHPDDGDGGDGLAGGDRAPPQP